MPTDKEIAARLRLLVEHRPSAIRNSIVMGILQFLSYLFGWGGILGSVWLFASPMEVKCNCQPDSHNQVVCSFINHQEAVALSVLVGGILLLLVWRLSKMVRRRNLFILNAMLALEDEEETN